MPDNHWKTIFDFQIRSKKKPHTKKHIKVIRLYYTVQFCFPCIEIQCWIACIEPCWIACIENHITWFNEQINNWPHEAGRIALIYGTIKKKKKNDSQDVNLECPDCHFVMRLSLGRNVEEGGTRFRRCVNKCNWWCYWYKIADASWVLETPPLGADILNSVWALSGLRWAREPTNIGWWLNEK